MNKKVIYSTLFALLLLVGTFCFAQKYQVKIEPFSGLVKADPRLILQSGYLVVPEDRSQPSGSKVKLPFFFVRRADQDAHKNVSLYMTGGPGYSTIANIDSVAYNSGFLKYGGFIAFDQRGTKKAQPCLDCDMVYEAIKESYRKSKDRDSLVLMAVKECRERLQQQGINLSAYNSAESVADINDLRLALKLDSLNLVGISYSGGLMLSMARSHPEGVKTLILNSPLPGFVNYEETALFNINEALDQVFTSCEKDSTHKTTYANLRMRFQQYFSGLGNKKFQIAYKEKGSKDSISITYGKHELIEAIVNRLTTNQVKEVPRVIVDLISGKHKSYIEKVLDESFMGNTAIALGMRYSVYCSEQLAYSNPSLEKQEEKLFPWLAGYRFNNVDHTIAKIWAVKPVPKAMKSAFSAKVPALISAGTIDPWCRPFYNQAIKRYLPNSQLLIIQNRGHGAGFNVDGYDYLATFMHSPYQKIESKSKNLIIE